MRTFGRLVLTTIVAAGVVAAVPVVAHAAVECTFANGTKTATVSLGNDDYQDRVWIGRQPSSNKLGYYTNAIGEWRGCDGASVTNTDKFKVAGGDLSDEVIVNLEYGALGPGATQETRGVSEIEVVLNLGSGTNHVTLLGGDGNNRLGFTRATSGFFNGDADADISIDDAEVFLLDGGAGDDFLDGRGVPEIEIWAREGDDRLFGGEGRDRLYGDDGEDSGDGNDQLSGGGGADYLFGDRGADVLNGGGGDDNLNGALGSDRLIGGGGDDDFTCSSVNDGADTIDGGPGNEWYGCWSRTAKVSISLDGKANDGLNGENDNVKGSVENIAGGSGNDVLIGSNADNQINGEAGHDTIKGLGGDDYLRGQDGDDDLSGGDGDDDFYNQVGLDKYLGGNGDDTMYDDSVNDGRDVFSGGEGYDSLSFYERTDPLTIDVTDPGGDGGAGGSENDDVQSDFEYLEGGEGADIIYGSSKGERIDGRLGDDELYGRGGADSLNGEGNNDTLEGGEGWDDLDGSSGTDTFNAIDGGQDDIYCGGDAGNTVFSDVFDNVSGCL